MQIVVISPEGEDPREIPAMSAMFASGLRRYHVRKPQWTAERLEAWLRSLPVAWRRLLVLHQHQELVAQLRLGGSHTKDTPAGQVKLPQASGPLSSRSTHDLATLKASLGKFHSVFFGPVFPSISKKGYGPAPDFPAGDLRKLLAGRGLRRKSTSILALGGVTAENLALVREMGFDGAAVHGAVWGVPNSSGAFARIWDAAAKKERRRRAA